MKDMVFIVLLAICIIEYRERPRIDFGRNIYLRYGRNERKCIKIL